MSVKRNGLPLMQNILLYLLGLLSGTGQLKTSLTQTGALLGGRSYRFCFVRLSFLPFVKPFHSF